MAQAVLNTLVCSVESVLPDRRSCVSLLGHLDASLMMSAVQLGWGQVGRERQVRWDYSVRWGLGQRPSELSKPPGLGLSGIRGITNSCKHSRLKNEELETFMALCMRVCADLRLKDRMHLIDTSLKAVRCSSRSRCDIPNPAVADLTIKMSIQMTRTQPVNCNFKGATISQKSRFEVFKVKRNQMRGYHGNIYGGRM